MVVIIPTVDKNVLPIIKEVFCLEWPRKVMQYYVLERVNASMQHVLLVVSQFGFSIRAS